MAESIVVICPTPQALMPAADWHDGQYAHGVHAGVVIGQVQANETFERLQLASKANCRMPSNVRVRDRSGKHLLAASISHFDPWAT
jgi:hypothetical protein